jgi:hypothetical protein
VPSIKKQSDQPITKTYVPNGQHFPREDVAFSIKINEHTEHPKLTNRLRTNHIFPETPVCSVKTPTLDELPKVLEAQV